MKYYDCLSKNDPSVLCTVILREEITDVIKCKSV